MAAHEDEAALIARAVAGDAGAFAVLVRRHGSRLARIVRALGVATGEEEDVVQEAFLAAWRALASFRRGADFFPWVSVIAVNKARDWSRRRPRGQSVPLDDAPEAASAQAAGEGADAAADRIDLQRLLRAIAALPEAQRSALVLTTVGGLTQAEAAAALSTSRKSVEMLVTRARARLRPVSGEV